MYFFTIMKPSSLCVLHLSPGSAPTVSKSSQWSTWGFASVATICIIIFLLSYLRLLQRLFCNFSSGNRVGRRLLNETNPDNPSLQFYSYGLDFSVIHSLPVSQFMEENGERGMFHQSNTDCVVCLGEFQEGEWLRHLPNCKHVFCYG